MTQNPESIKIKEYNKFNNIQNYKQSQRINEKLRNSYHRQILISLTYEELLETNKKLTAEEKKRQKFTERKSNGL